MRFRVWEKDTFSSIIRRNEENFSFFPNWTRIFTVLREKLRQLSIVTTNEKIFGWKLVLSTKFYKPRIPNFDKY